MSKMWEAPSAELRRDTFVREDYPIPVRENLPHMSSVDPHRRAQIGKAAAEGLKKKLEESIR